MPDPVPALDKVLSALKATFDAAPALSGDAAAVDRAKDAAWGKGELPARNILERQTVFSAFDHSSTLHRAEVDIDHIAPAVEGLTNAAALRLMEANTVAALWADRTLGGLVQDIQLDGSGTPEDLLIEEGARTLSIVILFLTPVGDHFTVVGADGIHL